MGSNDMRQVAAQLEQVLRTLNAGAQEHSIDEALDRYDVERLSSPSLSPYTVARVRREVAYLRERFCGEPIAGSWRERALHVYAERPRPTASLVCCTLAAVLRAAERWGWRTGDPEIRDLAKVWAETREYVMPVDDLGRLAAVLEDFRRRPYFGAGVDVLWTMALTGCRVGGVSRWAWERVAPDLRSVVQTSKRKTTRVALGYHCAELLRMRKIIGRGSPWVFAGRDPSQHVHPVAVSRLMRRACKEAGIRDTSAHTLRHSWATHAVREGVPTEIVRRVLGHSTQYMSARYVHLFDDDMRHASDRMAQLYTGGTDG